MEVDLYIMSIHKPHSAGYCQRFDRWVRVRDRATTEEEKARAQKEITKYFHKMYERGYFRDSYNLTNLLWRFGLS